MSAHTRFSGRIAATAALLALTLAGCSRDTRVNSDPGPGRPSQADGGKAANKGASDATTASQPGTSATVGTDSTGRPADSSGGVTGAGSGSQTSGTQTESKRDGGR